MKISLKQYLGLTAASCLALAGSVLAKPPGGASPGNSSFGMNQRTDLQTGPGNSAFGRNTAENARSKSSDVDDQDDQDVPRTKKVKTSKLTSPGNSAFGRSQRVNHLKGSGNNIHGKTTSANAKLKHMTPKTKTND
ncbi:MAG TPA: hypothetical protein VGH00_00015 [Chthoniobacterales bacterium]|jgi:hypothetical protein